MNSEFRESEGLSQKTLAFYSGTYSFAYGYIEWERVSDLEEQRQGIDVRVTTTGTTLSIEEKSFCINSPDRQYPDVCIELWHEYPDGSRTPGWIYKEQASDIFAFAWPYQKLSMLVETEVFLEWFDTNEKRLILEYRVLPHRDRYSGKQSFCLFIHRNDFIRELDGRVTVLGRDRNGDVFVLDGQRYLRRIGEK